MAAAAMIRVSKNLFMLQIYTKNDFHVNESRFLYFVLISEPISYRKVRIPSPDAERAVYQSELRSDVE